MKPKQKKLYEKDVSDTHDERGGLDGDDAINYGGGSNQAARVKSNTVDWDDWK